MSKRRQWHWWLGLALVLLVGLGTLLWLRPTWLGLSGGERRVAVVKRETVRATIRTIGRVQSSRVLAVGSPVSALVALVAVRPGDQVERGDVLAELEATGVERDLARARSTLETAELRLTAAQLNANREGAGAAELASLYAAGNDVQTARNNLANAEELRRAVLVVAPVAGTVVSVNVRERQPYSAGGEVATLQDLTSLLITAEIDEVDLAAAQRGSEVRVTLDAYPGRELPGRLTAIAPLATQRQGSTVFPATIEFERPSELDIRPGMSANIAIVTASRAETLALPSAAVRRIGERRYVQVVRPGGTEQVEIKAGLEGDGQLEVASGLSEGEVVVLP